MKVLKTVFNCIFPLIVVAVIFLFWWVAAIAVDASLILPMPSEAMREFFEYVSDSVFWVAVGYTIWRSIYSFLISFFAALIFSLLSYRFQYFKKFAEPLIAFIRSVPTMAVILILIIWMNPQHAPAAVAVIVIFPTMYSAFIAILGTVDRKNIEMSRVYRVSRWNMLTKLYLPAMSEGIFEGAASNFSLNMKVIIASEALASTVRSIGNMMSYQQGLLETEKLFALTVAAILLSVLFEYGIRLIGRLCIRWK